MTFKSKIKSDEWQTPFWLFRQLNDRFVFSMDAACTEHNTKVPRYDFYNIGFNGLKIS